MLDGHEEQPSERTSFHRTRSTRRTSRSSLGEGSAPGATTWVRLGPDPLRPSAPRTWWSRASCPPWVWSTTLTSRKKVLTSATEVTAGRKEDREAVRPVLLGRPRARLAGRSVGDARGAGAATRAEALHRPARGSAWCRPERSGGRATGTRGCRDHRPREAPAARRLHRVRAHGRRSSASTRRRRARAMGPATHGPARAW